MRLMMSNASNEEPNPEESGEHALDTLGGRIVRARESLGLSTAQLARRLGVETETLNLWETDRAEPRPNRLVTLAGLLNVSLSWLLVEEGEGPSDQMTKTDIMRIGDRVDSLRDKAGSLADELENLRESLDAYESFQDD